MSDSEREKKVPFAIENFATMDFLQVITMHIQVNFITQRLSFSGTSVDGFKRLNDFLLLYSPYWQSFPFVPVAVLHDLETDHPE